MKNNARQIQSISHQIGVKIKNMEETTTKQLSLNLGN